MSHPAAPRAQADPSALAYFHDLEPPESDFLSDVLEGLSATPKHLSPKYFYDKRGSEIFNDICRTDEYYVTRTETALLKTIGPELRDLIDPGAIVIEFGSGSSWKIRTVLDALDRPSEYLALDISRDHLIEAATEIARDYPSVRVGAVCADFLQPLSLPAQAAQSDGRRIGFLPGSTIGNLLPEDAATFLAGARTLLEPHGALLIGVDLIKDKRILDAAYNDAEGHTAAFNLNLLHRMRRELGADLTPGAFEHYAYFNEDKARVEMHLRAKEDLAIHIAEHRFPMQAGETIHTENSHKYAIPQFQALAERAGFTPRHVWTDQDGLFSVHLLDAASG